MPEILLSPRQLAERLGISLRTLERMRNTGSGPAFNRVSGGLRRGRVMYRESAVLAWLETRQCRNTVSPLVGNAPTLPGR
jgi:predicted DNA-binding transcriptional regulator AlpA